MHHSHHDRFLAGKTPQCTVQLWLYDRRATSSATAMIYSTISRQDLPVPALSILNSQQFHNVEKLDMFHKPLQTMMQLFVSTDSTNSPE